MAAITSKSSGSSVEEYLMNKYGQQTQQQNRGITAQSTGAEVEKYLNEKYQAPAPKTTAQSTGGTAESYGGGYGGGVSSTVARTGADIPLTKAYDPSTDANYQAALQALRAAQDNMPTYAGTFESQLTDLYDQIVHRDPFSYDVNRDALYQQYRDIYTRQGRAAMQDTMGQAAALTGGYNSTYAQSAGQQAYDAYLQQLNSIVPELYAQARSDYQQEGNDLLTQYGLLEGQRDTEYGRYQDEMAYWQNALSRAINAESTAYNRGLTAAEGENAARAQNYDRIMALAQAGYEPSDNELKAAGMSRDELNAWKSYYAAAAASAGGGGGSSKASKSAESGQDVSAGSGVAESQYNTAVSAYQREGSEGLRLNIKYMVNNEGMSTSDANALFDYVIANYKAPSAAKSSGTPYTASGKRDKNGNAYSGR